jgi:hypothetical protein
LALARSLVQMQGGRIEAHSAGPGLGSRFEVTLPTLDASVHGAPSAGGAEALPRDHDDVDALPPAPLLNERGATGT